MSLLKNNKVFIKNKLSVLGGMLFVEHQAAKETTVAFE